MLRKIRSTHLPTIVQQTMFILFVKNFIHSLAKILLIERISFKKKNRPQNNDLSMDSKQGLLVDEMLEVRSEFLIMVA
jgi:hypothetical protein